MACDGIISYVPLMGTVTALLILFVPPWPPLQKLRRAVRFVCTRALVHLAVLLTIVLFGASALVPVVLAVVCGAFFKAAMCMSTNETARDLGEFCWCTVAFVVQRLASLQFLSREVQLRAASATAALQEMAAWKCLERCSGRTVTI